ncbi:hypothetical protein [Micromonospora carbonacea]|uniref:hypothetical protein n=1 Tax=Micromonospora carbonacea TaxID=47853 RepID=UPI003712D44D
MTHPRLTLWDWLRSNLRDHHLHNQLNRMESAMATAAEQINNLSAKVDDIAADFRAFRDAMNAERENLTPDGQAALDAANAKLDAFDTEVGDADGSDTPTEPTEPDTDTFR